MTLLEQLRMERERKYKGGLYHMTQILMSYNTNAIEGSTLTKEHTRSIFETNTILTSDNELIKIDDIQTARNHFRAFDYILDHANDELSEELIKDTHRLVVEATAESYATYFNVGEYKAVPNTIGGYIETTAPEDVPEQMHTLIQSYNKKDNVAIEDIIDFHHAFESIHPFQDGNGRVGRLIMFKECLHHGHTPILIPAEYKEFYIRGLAEYNREKGYLRDTCLFGQDTYGKLVQTYSLQNQSVKTPIKKNISIHKAKSQDMSRSR